MGSLCGARWLWVFAVGVWISVLGGVCVYAQPPKTTMSTGKTAGVEPVSLAKKPINGGKKATVGPASVAEKPLSSGNPTTAKPASVAEKPLSAGKPTTAKPASVAEKPLSSGKPATMGPAPVAEKPLSAGKPATMGPAPVADRPEMPDSERLPIAFVDFLWPRKGAIARWELQIGAQLLQAVHDAYSPLNLPFSLGVRLTAYDAIKRFRWRPFSLFLAFEENGRADRYDTVNYGYNIFDVDVAVHVHPQIHFYYDLSILRSGAEMHVSDAGLSVRMGVRIPFWFRDARPYQYDMNHLHLVLLPISATLLGATNRDNLSGFNAITPALNGHVGLEWYMTPLPWLGVHAQAYAHLNFNLEQTLLLRGRAGVDFSLGRAVSVRLAMIGQWYPNPPPIRTNLYTLYFLQFPSFGAELVVDIRFSEWLKNTAGGAR